MWLTALAVLMSLGISAGESHTCLPISVPKMPAKSNSLEIHTAYHTTCVHCVQDRERKANYLYWKHGAPKEYSQVRRPVGLSVELRIS